MPAFLVTGNPGSGKSTVAAELTRRGYFAIDPDYDEELSYWVDQDGNRVDGHRVDEPGRPEEWGRSHRWVWGRQRLEEVLVAQGEAPLFICGIALNLAEVVHLFDQVFLLRIEATTQESRLVDYDMANPPGRSDAGRQQIREGRAIFEALALSLGAVAVDGSAPTSLIADQLLALTGLST
jgi:hypothetical protein